MDSVYDNALKRREELAAELAELDRFIRFYDRIAETLQSAGSLGLRLTVPSEAQEQKVADASPESEREAMEEAVSDVRPKRGLSKEALRPHIAEAIRAAGRPLTRGQILQVMDARGVPVGGEFDRSKNMGTIMWRLKDDFVSLGGFGYWPRGVAYSPAGYDPEDMNSPEAMEHTVRESEPADGV